MTEAFPPGARARQTGYGGGAGFEVDGKTYSLGEIRAAGFVPERNDLWTNEWVLANAFAIRGIFPRTEAHKLPRIDEAMALVRQYLEEHGVEMAPHQLECMLFNHEPNVTMPAMKRDAETTGAS